MATRISWQASIYRMAFRVGLKPVMKYSSVSQFRAYMSGLDMAVSISGRVKYNNGGFRVESTPHGELLTLQEGESNATILYVPGGGFISRCPNAHRVLVRRICKLANASASIIHYRLSPENPFPAAIEDVMAAYNDLLHSGVHPGKIVIAGDSAGGNLAVAATLALRDEGARMPAGVAVLSPVADLTFSGKSRHTNRYKDPMLPADRKDADARHYIADHDPRDPLISPVFADYRGMPPILAQVGSDEILLDDSVRICRSAEEAGVPAELAVWHKMPHGWPMFPGLPEGDLALAELASFIERVTGAHSVS